MVSSHMLRHTYSHASCACRPDPPRADRSSSFFCRFLTTSLLAEMAPLIGVEYTKPYKDSTYEYRHVHLPREVYMANLERLRSVAHGEFLSEPEWRELGLQMSEGWQNYLHWRREPLILLFRRPLLAARSIVDTVPTTSQASMPVQQPISQAQSVATADSQSFMPVSQRDCFARIGKFARRERQSHQKLNKTKEIVFRIAANIADTTCQTCQPLPDVPDLPDLPALPQPCRSRAIDRPKSCVPAAAPQTCPDLPRRARGR